MPDSSETANGDSVTDNLVAAQTGDGASEAAQDTVADLENDAFSPVKGSQTPFWGKAKAALGNASSRVSATGIAVASKAADLGKQTYVTAANAAESSGATQAVKTTAAAVGGKLDEMSGKRLVELLEQKLRIQDSYNDVLATRLAEALERIAVLEARVNELGAKS